MGYKLCEDFAGMEDSLCIKLFIIFFLGSFNSKARFYYIVSQLFPVSRVVNLQDSRLRQGVGPGTGRPVHSFLYKPFGNVWVCMGLFLY